MGLRGTGSLEVVGSRGFELSFAPSEARKSPPRILADVSKANGRLCPKGKAPNPSLPTDFAKGEIDPEQAKKFDEQENFWRSEGPLSKDSETRFRSLYG